MWKLSDTTKMKTSPKPPADPLESMKAPLKPPPIDPKEAIKGHQAGDGIRSMEVLIVFVHYFDILTFRPPVCSEHWISSCMWSQTSTSWPLASLPSAVALATLLTWKINTESKDFTQQLMTMTKCTSPKKDQNGTSWVKCVYSLEDFTEQTMSQLVPPVVLKASKKHTGKSFVAGPSIMYWFQQPSFFSMAWVTLDLAGLALSTQSDQIFSR